MTVVIVLFLREKKSGHFYLAFNQNERANK